MADKKELQAFINEVKGPLVAKALCDNGFEAYYEATAEEGVKKALSLIPEGSVVSWGGSVSIVESGLIEQVKKNGYKVIDRDTASSSQEKTELMRQALTCDVFLTSFNAVSEEGTAVNIDGNGNRTAAIAFGPKYVIALVGMNKVVPTTADAYDRAKNTAAPLNAARFDLMKSERVHSDPDGLCALVQILRSGGNKGRIKVVLTGEELGY